MESREFPGPGAALPSAASPGAVPGGDQEGQKGQPGLMVASQSFRWNQVPAVLGAGERGQSQPGMSPAPRDKASCGGQEKPHFPAFLEHCAVVVASPEVNSVREWAENPTQLNFGGADASLFSELTKG